MAILKHIPIGLAFFSLLAFASATPIAQLASSSNTPAGIWVKLCATGVQAFIPLGARKDNEERDSPAPGHHSQACHACADRRFGDNPDDDEGNDPTAGA